MVSARESKMKVRSAAAKCEGFARHAPPQGAHSRDPYQRCEARRPSEPHVAIGFAVPAEEDKDVHLDNLFATATVLLVDVRGLMADEGE